MRTCFPSTAPITEKWVSKNTIILFFRFVQRQLVQTIVQTIKRAEIRLIDADGAPILLTPS